MADDFIAHARKQAERSLPPVRVAARLRIARVQSTVDPGQARITFEMALDEIRSLPGRERDFFFQDAQKVAAAFAPDLLREIPPVRSFGNDFHSGMLVKIMLQHGHIDAAFDYVNQGNVPGSFPYGYVINLMHQLDDERRLIVLRRVINTWRASVDEELTPKQGIPPVEGHSRQIPLLHLQLRFVGVFQGQWKILPADEARAVVREVVRIAVEQPDIETSARYGDEVRITSSRAHVLFEVLHILRHLDAPLSESLIADHEQLAAAARRYPNGIETIHEELEERRKQKEASGATCGGGFIGSGSPRDRAYQMALRQASLGGDFGPPIDHALERYVEDTASDGPNQAPRTFWPSTCAFRTILYAAGKRIGPEANLLLERIPDEDLGLFARIELAAALAGLPELPEVWRTQRCPPERNRG
jgi:hypothetical protein